jgi:hypothetical protein
MMSELERLESMIQVYREQLSRDDLDLGDRKMYETRYSLAMRDIINHPGASQEQRMEPLDWFNAYLSERFPVWIGNDFVTRRRR